MSYLIFIHPSFVPSLRLSHRSVFVSSPNPTKNTFIFIFHEFARIIFCDRSSSAMWERLLPHLVPHRRWRRCSRLAVLALALGLLAAAAPARERDTAPPFRDGCILIVLPRLSDCSDVLHVRSSKISSGMSDAVLSSWDVFPPEKLLLSGH